MTRVPVLLIESLDSAGAAPDDARLRAAALRAAGFAPRTLVIVPASAPGGNAARAAHPGAPVISRREAPGAVREILASGPVELALVVSSAPGGEEISRWLPAATPALWWPGGLVASAPPRRLPWASPRVLAALGTGDGAPVDAGPSATRSAHAALDWAVVDGTAASRRLLPLWDGEYVLAPAPLAGAAGEELLVAFAAVARERDALDLVVLADPQPVFERVARGLGVGTRVHFVGPATREAEWTWLKPASAVVFAGPGPIAAGLVMRALACGCPAAGLGADGIARALNAWLVAHGAGNAGTGSTLSALTTLTTALDRGLEVGRAIERGTLASVTHHPLALAARLRDVLPASPARIAHRRAA